VIAPGTPLRKRSPRWVVAASLVETGRLYARMVAQVQPSWIEAAGAHLVRRSYGEAEWSAERGMVVARETVSLYGRVLSSGRQVNFAGVDPATARRMFVEEALVRRQSSIKAGFLDRNDGARRAIERLEAKLRRRDLLAHDDVLAAFYLERIPADVASARSFEHWWRAEERRQPNRLDMPQEAMLAQALPEVPADAYPDTWTVDGNELPLDYVFDATSPDDGVTLTVPLPLLGALSPVRLDWLVPGMLRDKVVALLRGLPKELRRELVPMPEAADRFLASLEGDREGSLFERLASFVTERSGRATQATVFAGIALPDALRLNFRVLDAGGREIRRSRDLEALRRELRSARAAAAVTVPGHAWDREGVRRWDFGDIPQELTARIAGVSMRMYPGIEDTGGAVRLRLYPGATQARLATRDGVVRLAALAMPQQHDLVRRNCAADRELTLLAAAAGMGRGLFDEIADRAVAEAIHTVAGDGLRSAAAFDAAVSRARSCVAEQGSELTRSARATLAALKEARAALGALGAPAFASARDSIEHQLATLVAPGWLRRTPEPWLRQIPKYLRAAARRAERLRNAVERDRRLQEQLVPYESALRELELAGAADAAPAPERERLRWMVEEFRVSLFAQELRTLQPVSARRLDEQLRLARAESRDPLATARAHGPR
jgi:ATP-dependent helicase HrpA